MLRFLNFLGGTYGFYLSKFFTFNLKKRRKKIGDINVASIVVWQYHFAHSCYQIHFTLFCRKFTFVVIYALIFG